MAADALSLVVGQLDLAPDPDRQRPRSARPGSPRPPRRRARWPAPRHGRAAVAGATMPSWSASSSSNASRRRAASRPSNVSRVVGLLERRGDPGQPLLATEGLGQVLGVGVARAVERLADRGPQARGGQPGRQPVDRHDPAGVEDLGSLLGDRLELGVVERQLPAEPLDLARDDDLAADPAAAARCSGGRTRSPRSSPVSSSSRAIVRWTRRRNVGSTRTSATRTRADTTVPGSVQTRSPSRCISRRSS